MKNKVISYIEFYTYGTKKIINNISSKYNHLNKKYIIILIIGLMLFGSLTGFTDLVNGSNAPNVISNNLIHTLPKTSNSIIHKNSIFNTQIKEYYPLYINNTQSIATPSPYQQLINITTSSFSPYLHFNNTSANFEFLFGNGSVIHSWIESNISGIIKVWLKLPQINANSNIEINLAFGALTTNFLSNSGISGIGEAPQLSSTYGQFDNGASVFPSYYNFKSGPLPSFFTNNGITYTINNGLNILHANTAYGSITTSYMPNSTEEITAVSVTASGAGRVGMPINDSAGSQYFWSKTSGNPYTLRTNSGTLYTSSVSNSNYNTISEYIRGKTFYTTLDGINYNNVSSVFPSSIFQYYFGENSNSTGETIAYALYMPNILMPTTSVGAIKINSNIINVGNNPNDIAISSNNIYVTNYGSGNVSVIGLSNNTNWKQITVGSFGCEPDAIALSTDNVYVASYVSGNVSIIGLSNNTNWKTIKVGTQPISITISSNNAYVTNYGSSNVSIIGLSNNTNWKQISIAGSPETSIKSANNIYIAGYTSNTIYIIGLSNNTNWKNITVGHQPYGMTMTNNNLYTANYYGDNVSVIGLSNNTNWKQIPIGSNLNAIEISSNNAYTANYGSNTVSVIGLSNNTNWKTIKVGTEPYKIGISSNNAYVTNYGSSNVSIIGLLNNTNWKTIKVGAVPDAIALSSFNAYIANFNSHSVSVINLTNPTNPSNPNWSGSMFVQINNEINNYLYRSPFETKYNWYFNLTSGSYTSNENNLTTLENIINGTYNWTAQIFFGNKTIIGKTYTVTGQTIVSLTSSNEIINVNINFPIYAVRFPINYPSGFKNNYAFYELIYNNSTVIANRTIVLNSSAYSQYLINVTYILPVGNYGIRTIIVNKNTALPINESFNISNQNINISLNFKIPKSVTFYTNGLLNGINYYLLIYHNGTLYKNQTIFNSSTFIDIIQNGTYTIKANASVIGKSTEQYEPITENFTVIQPNSLNVYLNFTKINAKFTISISISYTNKWNFTINNTIYHNITTSQFSVNLPNGSYNWKINQTGYWNITGSITVNDVNINIGSYTLIESIDHAITFISNGFIGNWSVGIESKSYAFPNGSWQYTIVNANYSIRNTTLNSHTWYIPLGSYTYVGQSGNDRIYGNISFTKNDTYYLNFSVVYSITFTLTGEHNFSTWYVYTNNHNYSNALTVNSFTIYLSNGSYNYSAFLTYQFNKPISTYTVSGNSQTIDINFKLISGNFTIYFTENGLSNNALWNIEIDGQNHSSTTKYINLTLPNDIYQYNASSFGYYNIIGNANISTTNTSITLNFASTSLYTITFIENNLTSISYKLIINYTWRNVGYTLYNITVTTSSYNINLKNYSYSYYVKETGFDSLSNAFTINGKNENIYLNFTEYTYTVTFIEHNVIFNINYPYFYIYTNNYNNSVSSTWKSGYSIQLVNGLYTYSAWDYYTNKLTGSYRVNNASITIYLNFTIQYVNVTYYENNITYPNWSLWTNGSNITGIKQTQITVKYTYGIFNYTAYQSGYTILSGSFTLIKGESSLNRYLNFSIGSGTTNSTVKYYSITVNLVTLNLSSTDYWTVEVLGNVTTSPQYHGSGIAGIFNVSISEKTIIITGLETNPYMVIIIITVPYNYYQPISTQVNITNFNITISANFNNREIKLTGLISINIHTNLPTSVSIRFTLFNSSNYSLTVSTNGNFTIPNMPTGIYTYIANANGYYNQSGSVNVKLTIVYTKTGIFYEALPINIYITFTSNKIINNQPNTFSITVFENGLTTSMYWTVEVLGNVTTSPQYHGGGIAGIFNVSIATYNNLKITGLGNGTYSVIVIVTVPYNYYQAQTFNIIINGANQSFTATFSNSSIKIQLTGKYSLMVYTVNLPSNTIWLFELTNITGATLISTTTNQLLYIPNLINGSYTYIAIVNGFINITGQISIIGHNTTIILTFQTIGSGNNGNGNTNTSRNTTLPNWANYLTNSNLAGIIYLIIGVITTVSLIYYINWLSVLIFWIIYVIIGYKITIIPNWIIMAIISTIALVIAYKIFLTDRGNE